MDVILARFTVPALIVAISAVVGFLIDRVVVTRIRKTSAARGWVGGEVTARSLEGIVVVLDARIRTKRYGRLFLKSLPECPVEVEECDAHP